ncbi:MAG TPA: hypothetical protein VFX25_12505 [Streptosporangiaceae bacterium]|nr:hypothetical protein [Streptosporangiaceae bacterium]
MPTRTAQPPGCTRAQAQSAAVSPVQAGTSRPSAAIRSRASRNASRNSVIRSRHASPPSSPVMYAASSARATGRISAM